MLAPEQAARRAGSLNALTGCSTTSRSPWPHRSRACRASRASSCTARSPPACFGWTRANAAAIRSVVFTRVSSRATSDATASTFPRRRLHMLARATRSTKAGSRESLTSERPMGLGWALAGPPVRRCPRPRAGSSDYGPRSRSRPPLSCAAGWIAGWRSACRRAARRPAAGGRPGSRWRGRVRLAGRGTRARCG